MEEHSIHTSRYGMAVPTEARRGFSLHRATSLRWAEISGAMRRVVDGVRLSHDDGPSLLDVPSADSAASHAGCEHERPMERLEPD